MAAPASDAPLRTTRRSLPIALLRAREKVMEPIRGMLADSQISEQKWRVLRVVREEGPMEQTAIAQAACLLLPSLTRIIHALEKDGLLARTTSAQDRRKSIVKITDKGAAFIAEHSKRSKAIFDTLEAQLGKEKLETLLDLLEELHGVKLD